MEYKKRIIASIERVIETVSKSIAGHTDKVRLFKKRMEDPEWKDNESLPCVNDMVIMHDIILKAELSALRISIRHIQDSGESDDAVLYEGRDTLVTALFTADKHRRNIAPSYRAANPKDGDHERIMEEYSKFVGMSNGFVMALSCFHVTPDFEEEIIPF